MDAIGTYLIQMACWLTAFWLVYILFLKNETFFQLNRWFLISGLVIAILTPLIPVTYKVYQTVQPMHVTLTELQTVISPTQLPMNVEKSINYWLLIYLAGCMFYLCRIIIQHYKLYKIRNLNLMYCIRNIKVYRVDKEIAPFSFFNHIYVSSKMCDATELDTVVAHEKVHISERHWADLLLLEVVRTFQWFNPLLYFYRKAILQNHEYLADKGTLSFGVSARTYKAVLANQMLGNQVVKFANSFTFLNSTKRLLMMKKIKSNPIKRLKFLSILPLTALIIVVFAKPVVVYSQNTISSEKIDEDVVYSQMGEANEDVKATTESQSIAISDQEEYLLAELLSNNKNTAPSTATISGTVEDDKGKTIKGAVVTNIGAGGQLLNSVTTNNDGSFAIDKVGDNDILIVTFLGFEPFKFKANNQKEMKIVMKALPQEKKAVKSIDSKNVEKVTTSGTVKDKEGFPIPSCNVIAIGSNNNFATGTITDKDGKFILGGLDPKLMVQFSMIGYKSAKFNVEKELNVQLTKDTVNYLGVTIRANDLSRKKTVQPDPTITIDGEIMDAGFSLDNINPEDIQTIEVFKKGQNPKKTGPKTDSIVINTKNHVQNQKKKYVQNQNKKYVQCQNKKSEEEPEEIFIIVEDMPKFINGEFGDYIEKNLNYPQKAIDSKISGKVYVSFNVDESGQVTDAKIAKGVDPLLDAEAIRVVKSSPWWIPGKQRGKAVNVNMCIPVEFVL